MGMVIGDVSGKGAPAAIYAALVSGILRSHAPIEPGPAEMLRAVNFSLGERRIEGQFVSLIYAVWDDRNRSLKIANSGLPRPLVLSMTARSTSSKPRACRWACSTTPSTTNSPSRPNPETCLYSSATVLWTPATGPETCLDVTGLKLSFRVRRDFRRLCGEVPLQGCGRAFRRRRGVRRRDCGSYQGERRTQAQVTPTSKRSAGRPPAFSYREVRQGFLRRHAVGTALECEDVSMERLAERVGTPLYVYSASTIKERLASFEHAFRKAPHTVCYSVKAN